MKRILRNTAVVLTLLSVSCSTMTVNYEANIVSNKNGPGKYQTARTIENKMLFPCIITGVFYGGLCWFNLMMPTDGQEMQLAHQVRADLDSRLGAGEYRITSENIYRARWGATLASEQLTFFKNKGQNYLANTASGISPEEFEKTILDKPDTSDVSGVINDEDMIPENWPQMYYYETDGYRYWTICGDLKKGRVDAMISSKKKAEDIIMTEFPANRYGTVKYDTTHIKIVKANNRYRSWRIIRIKREDINMDFKHLN